MGSCLKMSWKKCGKREFPQIVDFILFNEIKTLNISSRLMSRFGLRYPTPDRATLFYLQEADKRKGNLDALMMVTPGGDLYFTAVTQLNPADFEEALIIAESAAESINTIITIPEVPAEFSKIILQKINPRNSENFTENQDPLISETINYHLMLYSGSSNHIELTNRGNIDVKIDNKNHVRKLSALHSQYLQEEVSSPLRPITPHYADQIAFAMIKRQVVATAWRGDKMIAKANTNLCGVNVAQLGGIFTLKEERSRGAASQIVKKLSDHLLKQYSQVSLFVKKENHTAIRVYQKCGFETISNMTLFYFK